MSNRFRPVSATHRTKVIEMAAMSGNQLMKEKTVDHRVSINPHFLAALETIDTLIRLTANDKGWTYEETHAALMDAAGVSDIPVVVTFQ